jgi:hypothetical protein
MLGVLGTDFFYICHLFLLGWLPYFSKSSSICWNWHFFSKWPYEMPKPCYPKVCVLMSHPLRTKWFSFTPSCRFLWWMFTRAKVCFPFNRRSFGDCASMTLFMCRSKGKHLVISLSYYTNILFIIGPLSYNITCLSWLAKSYNGSPFMVPMWSYHWQSKYPFALVAQWEWTYNSSQHISRYCCNYCFGEQSTC